MSVDDERATLGAFVLGSVFAGGNAVAIRFSNRELDPLWGAGLRFLLAAAILLGLLVALGVGFPRGRALAGRCSSRLHNVRSASVSVRSAEHCSRSRVSW